MITELKRFEVPKIGVYFLFIGDDLIYIGQSIYMFNRILSYTEQMTPYGKYNKEYKDFDNYGFIKCDTQNDAKELEKEMIAKYKPVLNKTYTTYKCNREIELNIAQIKYLQSKNELLKKELELF